MLRPLLALLFLSLASPALAQVAEPTPEEGLTETLPKWGPELFVFAAGVGLGRSWTGDVQFSSVRMAGGGRRPWMAAGLEVDWPTDNRWRAKARTYQRVQFRIFAALDLEPFAGATIWLGGGAAGGIFRGGPTKQLAPAVGLFEFVQFNIHIKQGLMGVRVEQQQAWQPDEDLPEDHVTSFFFVVGGRVGI